MGEALEELKNSLKNLIAVQVTSSAQPRRHAHEFPANLTCPHRTSPLPLQVNLVTTVQESITAVAKVLEALDNDSLMASTANANAAIASTNAAIQHASTANTQLQALLPHVLNRRLRM